MRAFVLVFLLSAACVCARAQTEQLSTSQTEHVAGKAQTFVLGPLDSSKEQSGRVFISPDMLPHLSLSPEKPRILSQDKLTYMIGGSQCLKMRTYIVKRETSDSDVTTPAGYTECMPSNRAKLKNAVPQQNTDGKE